MKRFVISAASAATLLLAANSSNGAEVTGDIGVNAKLEAMGSNVRLAYAEFSVAKEGGFDTVKTVFFKDTGNKQLSSHWVPGDPRPFGGPTTDMYYVTDTVDGVANCGDGCTIDAATTTQQIVQGMAAWDAIGCASIPIVDAGAYPLDLGLVETLVGFGGTGLTLEGGITHGGWLPGAFFDAIGGPGGADNILGVTFTFIWIDDDGNATDINSDGKSDTALREIYMNNNFAWEVGNAMGTGVFDIVAVMNHEQGHALSQGHFGEISLNPKGKLIISPKNGDNVMLAAISSNQVFEGFHGSDIGGHCSIWATWPLQ